MLERVLADYPWYAAGAFALGFVVSWIACARPEPLALVDEQVQGGERRKGGLFRWLWRGYRAYDKASGWWDRINWLLGLFKTNVGMAAAAAAVGTAGTVTALKIHELAIVPRQATLQTAAIEPKEEVRQTKNSIVFAIEGKDKAGRRGTFDVVVLNKSFLWVRGSADQLEKDGRTIAGSDLTAAVLDDEVRAALADAIEVIAVGTASQEGSAVEEQARAERRARTAAALVAGALAANTPIWMLNLGQYRNPCKDCETAGTSWQRPFIVIAVTSLDPGTDLGEALADAMSGKERLPSPQSYSAFALKRFR